MSAVRRRPRTAPPLKRYINRELSWLGFNTRVLAEAEDRSNPLLERLKFLAIFESNLDEFFMVRVSGLIEQEATGFSEVTPDGLSPGQQLDLIAAQVGPLRERAAKLWSEGLVQDLRDAGIHLLASGDPRIYDPVLRDHFRRAVFPLCTPLMLSPSQTFPFISNRSLNLAVALSDGGEARLARVKVPPNVERLVPLPDEPETFCFLEDLIAANLDLLFPGVSVVGSYRFRVIRDADVEIREVEAADLITAVEQSLRLRRFGDVVLLEHDQAMPSEWLDFLCERLELEPSDTLSVEGLIGFDALWTLASLDRPELKYPPHQPYLAPQFARSEDLFDLVRQQDVLVHHPYDSFLSVERFVESVATDDRVVGIKIALYRVGAKSPIVQSLLDAAEAGKQVAAMVELKARFDESNNLVWSKALERAGVHVTYGFHDMKVHSKLCLVVRQEPDGLRSYVHIGTGNYNPLTARTYTDFGLFTADPDICQDVTEMFNFLTGYSKQSSYRRLLVAPLDLREGIIERIEREVALHQETGRGRVLFKLNALVDPEVIDALYEASEAGVEVKLAVRGICCLRPGVPRMSSNIEVASVVGRFLEHGRVYYFENGGHPDVWIGSSDMMRRNLDRRIEVLVNVRRDEQVAYLRDVILWHFRDSRAWREDMDGGYSRLGGEGDFSLQGHLASKPAGLML